MPGIVGLITRMPREEAEHQLQRMVDYLRHESFYETGTFADESLGVYVGWSAQRNSFSDGMPVSNERGDVKLFFSGEDFPEPGTAQELKRRGHALGPSSSSYLPHLFEEQPESFFAALNGRFHGLLVDRRDGTATLFNDRYSMHRLYYHQAKDAFYFAAEAKAILAIRPELRTIDAQGLGELASCGNTMEDRTLFAGVKRLPNASQWVFRGGLARERKKYFDRAEWEQQTPLESEAFYQETQQAFSKNVSRYFESHQRVGMSLTGGLDTRIILAWQNASPNSLPCYTFSGPFRYCRDVQVAQQVAALCKQSHNVIQVTRAFLEHFSDYSERTIYLTDGCVDVELAPDLYLNEKAREIAPIRMTGLYGSEVLRGVCGSKPERPLSGLFSPEVVSQTEEASRTYERLRGGHPLSFALFDQLPTYQYGILSLEDTQVGVRTPFLDNELVRTVFRAPKLSSDAGDISVRLIAAGNEALLQIPTDRGVGGKGSPISRLASRAALEFLFKTEYRYDTGMPQWLAGVDHAFPAFSLEKVFLGRHKIFHFRVWYRDVLSGYVREMLLDQRTLSRPYLNKKSVEMIVNHHIKGDRNYTEEIHKMLTLELLHRLFIDSGSFPADNRIAQTPLSAFQV